MKTIDLHEIAYKEGLELVSTTTGMNGYPQNVNYALIGLDDFQQAETLAKKYPCLKIVTLHKRDGWHLWEFNERNTYQAMQVEADWYGDAYDIIDCSSEEYFNDHVIPNLNTMYTMDELECFVYHHKKIMEHLDDLQEGYSLVLCNGQYHDEIKTETMRWNHDVHTYEIALVVDEQELESIESEFESIRESIQDECISYREIAYLQDHADLIDDDDVELLQWAGVSEEEYNKRNQK